MSLFIPILQFKSESCTKEIVDLLCKYGTRRDGTGSSATSCRPGEMSHTDINCLATCIYIPLQVKDLKRQLKLERKRAEQLQQKLQEALTENRVKPGELTFLFMLCFSLRLIGRRAP